MKLQIPLLSRPFFDRMRISRQIHPRLVKLPLPQFPHAPHPFVVQ